MIVPKEVTFNRVISLALSLEKDKKECGCIADFFQNYSENDFEELKQIASQYGFKVAKACNITGSDKDFYQKIWKRRKTLVIYWNENNL